MLYEINNTKPATVTNFTSFASAQKIAKPGDIFSVTGSFNEVVKWTVSGTEKQPIFIFGAKDEKLNFIGEVDGDYNLPSGKATRLGAEGLEGVDKPLVLIDASNIIWTVPIYHSRGRGLQIGSDKNQFENVTISSTSIVGTRTAAIDVRNGKNLVIDNVRTNDTSNYNTRVRDSAKYNYAGCIKTLDVDGLTVKNCIISYHYGNVLTPSRGTKNINLESNQIFDCWGSLIYLHYVNNCRVHDNYLYYSPDWKQSIHAGIVVNNEEEFVDEGYTPGNISIFGNYILGTDNGIALWGNEGTDIITDSILIYENTIINTDYNPILVRDNRKIKNVSIFKNVISFPKTDIKSINVNGGYSNLKIHSNGFCILPNQPAECSSTTDFVVLKSNVFKIDDLDHFKQVIKDLTIPSVDSEKEKLKKLLAWKEKFNAFKEEYENKTEELYQELSKIMDE